MNIKWIAAFWIIGLFGLPVVVHYKNVKSFERGPASKRTPSSFYDGTSVYRPYKWQQGLENWHEMPKK